MNIDSNIKLIDKIFKNDKVFEEADPISNYKILICKDYDNMNLFICKKNINSNVNKENYIKQLSKIPIRKSLFDSYFDITKLSQENENKWIEKIIYNKKNYNIQEFTKDTNYLLCYSNIELDDDSYEHIWINNPFTLITFENDNITLKIAFEISNTYQDEIIKNFLLCMDKLELALSTNNI